MDIDCTYLPYSETGYFSDLVLDYIGNAPTTKDFYKYTPDAAGLQQAIADRGQYPVNRQTLVSTLQKQYAALPANDKVTANIAALANDNTYTICTAHQPNLMTGYLYFIYKILHAIKLADELNAQHSDKHFVPVYYMGSEDNDLEELGTFKYADRKFVWDANGQTGAVGRMDTKSLKPLLDEFFRLLGPPGKHADELKEIVTNAYLKHKTVGAATQYLVHMLFGRYGLVVLDPDEAAFKQAILPVLQDDLQNHLAYGLVSEQIENIEEYYRAQAHPRLINLFYLKDNLRERIEKRGGKWIVLNTEIAWTEEEILAELTAHPERFSPNVILRGIFQESILPNVAFIGGGAEVAYWLELKPLFEAYKVFYPVILQRQSVQWINAYQGKHRKQLGFSVGDVFRSEVALVREYLTRNGNDNWHTTEETAAMEGIITQLKEKAQVLDPTLRSSADAVLAKVRYQLQVLEKKMLRAEKRKMQEQLQKIYMLKASIFPGNRLQERTDNFSGYYAAWGNDFFDAIYKAIKPLEAKFIVIEEQQI